MAEPETVESETPEPENGKRARPLLRGGLALAGWLLATAVAASLATLATGALAASPAGTLSEQQVTRALARSAATPTPPGSAPARTTAPTPAPSTGPAKAGSGTGAGAVTDSSSAPGQADPTRGAPPAQPGGAPPANAPAAPQTVRAGFSSAGGDVVASCTSGKPRIESATAAQGYRMHKSDDGDEASDDSSALSVAFSTEAVTVRVTVTCSGGQPQFSAARDS